MPAAIHKFSFYIKLTLANAKSGHRTLFRFWLFCTLCSYPSTECNARYCFLRSRHTLLGWDTFNLKSTTARRRKKRGPGKRSRYSRSHQARISLFGMFFTYRFKIWIWFVAVPQINFIIFDGHPNSAQIRQPRHIGAMLVMRYASGVYAFSCQNDVRTHKNMKTHAEGQKAEEEAMEKKVSKTQ